MEAFFVSLFSVAVAEMGDKTQLLAILLAVRFQKPMVIIAGMLVATILNHIVAGLFGEWIGRELSGNTLHLVLGVAFLAAAIWVMIPDKLDTTKSLVASSYSIFFTTMITFFLAEIGDKTQFVTAVLAAKYQALLPVVAGTTIGMLSADIPAVLLSNKAAKYVSMAYIRYIASAIFLIFAGLEFFNLLF